MEDDTLLLEFRCYIYQDGLFLSCFSLLLLGAGRGPGRAAECLQALSQKPPPPMAPGLHNGVSAADVNVQFASGGLSRGLSSSTLAELLFMLGMHGFTHPTLQISQ